MLKIDHQLSAYSYNLPSALIAQNPATPRDSSKLLVVDSPKTHQHRQFFELDTILSPGDLLVLNNTQVIPARLLGHKRVDLPSRKVGAPVEVLLIEPVEGRFEEEERCQYWLALVRPGRRLQPGAVVVFGDPNNPLMSAHIESRDEATGGRIVKLCPLNEFSSLENTTIQEVIYRLGNVPLPPYITQSRALPEQYQTIYAHKQGAVAAPTAGLHFTPDLFERLQAKNIQTAEITLHVGIGTFRPVEVGDIKMHQMHEERIEVSKETVEKIRHTKSNGGRVIAVGTTSTRALEGVAAINGELSPYQGRTEIFIYPGYRWQVIDGLITNFHLPESSLLMMVSALIGRDRLMQLYKEAIAQHYRFYSFGDAMLILPNATLSRSR